MTAMALHKYPWFCRGAIAVSFLMKQRMKNRRVLPALSTEDAAVDDTTPEEGNSADCDNAAGQEDTGVQGSTPTSFEQLIPNIDAL